MIQQQQQLNWTELNRTECNKMKTEKNAAEEHKKEKGCSVLPFLVSEMRFLWTIYDDITFQFLPLSLGIVFLFFGWTA